MRQWARRLTSRARCEVFSLCASCTKIFNIGSQNLELLKTFVQVAQSERSSLLRRIFVQNAQKFSTCKIFFVQPAQNPRKCWNVENYVENVEMLKTMWRMLKCWKLSALCTKRKLTLIFVQNAQMRLIKFTYSVGRSPRFVTKIHITFVRLNFVRLWNLVTSQNFCEKNSHTLAN